MHKIVQAIRKMWQVFFFFFVSGAGFYLFRSLFIVGIGNFFKYSYYHISITLFFFLLAAISYLFAFRCKNENLFANINISIGALILLLLVSEAGIRIWDHYDPIFRPAYLEDAYPIVKGAGNRKGLSPFRPNSKGLTHGHPLRINNLGFRGPDYPINKPANSFRILVLGDSFTFGQGIGDREVYTAVIERELGLKYPRKIIEAINLGVPGYSAIDEVNQLYRYGPLLNPDLILIDFTANDVREGNEIPERELNRLEIPLPGPIKSFFQSHFKIFAWLAIRYNQLLTDIGVRPINLISIESAYNTSSEEWKRFVADYKKILEWTQGQGIPPPIVGLLISSSCFDPDQCDYINIKDPGFLTLLRFHGQVQRILMKMGFHTVDYLPLFQQHNKQIMKVSKWEGHPGVLAHHLYAEGFLNSILALNLIHKDEEVHKEQVYEEHDSKEQKEIAQGGSSINRARTEIHLSPDEETYKEDFLKAYTKSCTAADELRNANFGLGSKCKNKENAMHLASKKSCKSTEECNQRNAEVSKTVEEYSNCIREGQIEVIAKKLPELAFDRAEILKNKPAPQRFMDIQRYYLSLLEKWFNWADLVRERDIRLMNQPSEEQQEIILDMDILLFKLKKKWKELTGENLPPFSNEDNI